MIKPTIGRQVWFHKTSANSIETARHPNYQPEAATVVYVHSDTMVNLQVLDHNGNARSVCSVTLPQGDEKSPLLGAPYAEWMPYQKGQAAKVEAREENTV